MKRIALMTAILAVAIGVYKFYPVEFTHYVGEVKHGGEWVQAKIEANPIPALLALGTFVLTAAIHKLRGKTLRESVAAAAMRGGANRAKETAEKENPVVRRAKARSMRAQLLADQINLQNRRRRLPDDLQKAEKETCYTEQALTDAERLLELKEQAHVEAVAKLEAIRKEKATSDAELAAIEAELQKLAELV